MFFPSAIQMHRGDVKPNNFIKNERKSFLVTNYAKRSWQARHSWLSLRAMPADVRKSYAFPVSQFKISRLRRCS